MFRLARLLRLFKRARILNDMFMTVVMALPFLFNISVLMLHILYIYGVMGVQLFGRIPINDNKITGLTYNANFRNLYYAIPTLYQASTGQGWSDLLEDCLVQAPKCSENDSCGTVAAYPYWLSFIVIGNLIILNTVVSIVLQNWAVGGEQVMRAFDRFKERWAIMDMEISKKLNVPQFVWVLHGTPQPLGLGYDLPGVDIDLKGHIFGTVLRMLEELQVPVTRQREVEYKHAVTALASMLLQLDSDGKKLESTSPATVFCVHHVIAARKIISMFQQTMRNRLNSEVNTPSQYAFTIDEITSV
eukprot:NODE_3367_length_1365_cov_4.421095_g2931_i0.p1 GENE.NODE_3367_length_1365_cov_4.421095_g2931_i0~~NODE_3367_length_1365_cov_4.421095_g2931_i0.p1  ORF type:complete len:348 (-),score=39.28 NODE_3367_length_1365_cov_4.421095_g2931_i0:320-1225(-)